MCVGGPAVQRLKGTSHRLTSQPGREGVPRHLANNPSILRCVSVVKVKLLDLCRLGAELCYILIKADQRSVRGSGKMALRAWDQIGEATRKPRNNRRPLLEGNLTAPRWSAAKGQLCTLASTHLALSVQLLPQCPLFLSAAFQSKAHHFFKIKHPVLNPAAND